MSKSWFINNIDSYVCKNLLEELTKDKENPPDFDIRVTYSDHEKLDRPYGVKKVIKRSKPKLFAKKLKETDILIYDLHELDINELRRIIDIIKNKKEKFENEKKIIIVSSMLSWFKTKKLKIEKNLDTENNEINKNDEENEDVNENNEDNNNEEEVNLNKENNIETNNNKIDENIENEENVKNDENIKEEEVKEETVIEYDYLPFSEKNFDKRIPHKCFEKQKIIEDELLNLKELDENLEVIIIYCGLIYGKGEMLLFDNIEKAWLQQPLKIFNSGLNKIPTFNIDNLSKLIIKWVDLEKDNNNYPKNNCIFAYEIPLLRQKILIKNISEKIGNNEIYFEKEKIIEKIEEYTQKEILNEFLKIKISFKSEYSNYVNNIEEEEEEEKEQEKEEENDENENEEKKIKNIKINLSNSILSKLENILEDFCKKQNLKPIKIILLGEQIEKFSKILSDHYKTPIIDLNDLFNKLNNKDNFYLTKMNKNLKYLWDIYGDDVIKRFKNNEINKNLDNIEIIFLRIIKWRLNLNDCKNKGYILIGFELNSNYYKLIFEKNQKDLKVYKSSLNKKIELIKEEEKKNQDKEITKKSEKLIKKSSNKTLDYSVSNSQSFFSNSSKYNISENESIFKEEKKENEEEENDEKIDDDDNNSENDKKNSNLENYIPETIIYSKDNKNLYDHPLINYCINKKIEYLYYYLEKKNHNEILYSLKIFIERNKRPYNYLEDEEIILKNLENYINKKEKNKKEYLEELKKNKDNLENNEVKSKEENALKQIEIIKNKIIDYKNIENKNNEDIREEFFNNYESIISEGLFEIIKIKPQDPIEFLSEFIYNKSYLI